MVKYKLEYYKDDNGKEPAKDFIESLDMKMRAKIYRLFNMISESGTELREPYSKHLEDGIFELRAKVGTDITRVLYFFYIGRRVVFTNGFIKKSQKTPKGEIKKAKTYRDNYIGQEGEDKNNG